MFPREILAYLGFKLLVFLNTKNKTFKFCFDKYKDQNAMI